MICKYKASIPGSKVFMREYEIKSETKLYRLHDFLLDDLGFSPDQMVIFQGVKDGKVSREYGFFDMGDGSMDSVSIEKTLSRGETVLRYLYNMNTHSYLDLAFISEGEPSPRASYPRLVAEKGHCPDQFSSKYEDDEFGEMENPSHLRGSVRDEDEDNQEYEEEELPEGEEQM